MQTKSQAMLILQIQYSDLVFQNKKRNFVRFQCDTKSVCREQRF